MNQEQTKPSVSCPDGHGALPACAPLAVPYVPFQQRNPRKYDKTDALSNGTLFPGLNLPFHLKTEAVNVGNAPLAELQALCFVIAELGLYLDTHCDDNEAFALFQEYVAMERDGRKRYEALFGPITQAAAADSNCFTWLNDPWPWEMNKGGEK